MSQLSTAGILRATRGAHGGVALARPADDISLLEIVETIDGPIVLNECIVDSGTCPLGNTCTIQSVWCEAQATLVTRLEQTKFGQLVRTPNSQAKPITS